MLYTPRSFTLHCHAHRRIWLRGVMNTTGLTLRCHAHQGVSSKFNYIGEIETVQNHLSVPQLKLVDLKDVGQQSRDTLISKCFSSLLLSTHFFKYCITVGLFKLLEFYIKDPEIFKYCTSCKCLVFLQYFCYETMLRKKGKSLIWVKLSVRESRMYLKSSRNYL